MANPRQKLKNRSSVSKVKRKPKSKKRILQNPIIAANWDKTQTLTQNYQRLGLTTKLNKITGGVERTVTDVEREKEDGTQGEKKGDALTIVGAKRRPERSLQVREAKIERDPESGKILRVLDDGDGKKRRANPLNDPLNELESDDSESEDEQHRAMFDQHGREIGKTDDGPSGSTQLIRQLEFEASRPVQKHKRRQTDNERAFIEELVRKYGDDIGKMARDMKINYMQRSEGDLKKRIKKWRDEGGRIE